MQRLRDLADKVERQARRIEPGNAMTTVAQVQHAVSWAVPNMGLENLIEVAVLLDQEEES